MIEILRKSWVALLVLLLALIAQIPHAAYVFDAAPRLGLPMQAQSNLAGWLLAYAYAIALESATLMFVVHGHKGASYGFALASFAVNLSYYAMHGVALLAGAAAPVWLLSALLPIAIASYSHILAGAKDEPIQWGAWWARVQSWRNAPAQVAKPVQVAPVEDAVTHNPPTTHPQPTYNPPTQDAPAPVAPIDAVQIDKRTRGLQLLSEGFTVQQVADELQANPNTVKAWKSRYSNGAKV